MELNDDFADLFSAFAANEVEFLVVGAHALAAHGHIRATKDLDVWIRPTPANARATMSALAAFGAPVSDLSEHDLARPGVVFQIGVAPIRIDLLTSIDGVEFSDAWRSRVASTYGEQPISVLSRSDLIANKKSAGRPQDLVDLAWLEKHPPA